MSKLVPSLDMSYSEANPLPDPVAAPTPSSATANQLVSYLDPGSRASPISAPITTSPWLDISPEQAQIMYGGGGAGMMADPLSAGILRKAVPGALNELWNLIKAPGQVLSGELTPSMEPGPNLLSIPEYAKDLALTGFGIRGANMLTRGGAFDPTRLEHFGVWHGTGADQPFDEFSDLFLSSGEGKGVPGAGQHYGAGHYSGEALGTGETYRGIATRGRYRIPLRDDGLPMTEPELLRNYFEPGSIVPNSSGGFDRVNRLNLKTDPNDPSHWADPNDSSPWSVDVTAVNPIKERIEAAYGQAPKGYFAVPPEALKDPSFWTDKIHGGAGPYTNPARNHGTWPGGMNIESVGEAKGWNMSDPGAIVHVNIIPEQHEFFDLDLPWNQQTDDIKARMTAAGLDPGSLPWYHGTKSDLEYVTGNELRQKWTNEIRDAMGISLADAKTVLSQQMNDAGIPGSKMLDQRSRGKPLSIGLKHRDGFMTAPNPDIAQLYLAGHPAAGWPSLPASLQQELNLGRGTIEASIGRLQNTLDSALKSGLRIDPADLANHQAIMQERKDLLDWMDKEHAAGNFSLGDLRTRNFIVFDPKNQEIRTWNGVPMTENPYIHAPPTGMRYTTP